MENMETPKNLFVAPVNIQTIEAFMSKVGYQGVVDKVRAFYMNNVAQPWKTLFKVFNRCLTTRTSGHNQTKINILQLFHAVINQTNVDYAALLWWDFINNVFQKKEAIQYPRFIKLIIADLMKKFPNIPQRIDEDYHSIKDDIPLVSVYTTGNVLVQGMLIIDECLTKEIRATDDFKEYEMVFMNVVEGEKDDDDSKDRLEPGSHKKNLKHVDDYDDEEKVDEKKDAEMGSLETRTVEMQTPIPTTPRSPRTILYSDKNITQELMDTVSLPTATTSKNPHSKQRISSRYNHLPGVLRLMCRRQGYMIQNMEQKCVTTKYFWKTHKKVDQVLHTIVPQLAERATDDLIENNLKPSIAATIIEDHDAFRSEVLDLVSQEFNAQAPKIIEELFKNYVQSNVIQVHPTTTTSTETTSSADLQQQLYLKMKRSLQDQANDPVLWEVLKRKFEKSSTSNTSCRDDDIHSQRHDDHQEDDAPPEGEKRVKRHKASKSSKSARGSSSKHSAKDSTTYVSKQQQQQEWDAWVEETVIDEDEVIPKDETPELITELQNVDKHVPTIFDRARIEATLNDMLSNQFKNAKEYAYHLEQTTNFIENQIVLESRQKDIRRPVPRPLIFFGPQQNPNEPLRYLYNKDLFFLKNGNTKEKNVTPPNGAWTETRFRGRDVIIYITQDTKNDL
ncbi:hypothetical protein Tco_1014655 [Tanacetum coccineum]